MIGYTSFLEAQVLDFTWKDYPLAEPDFTVDYIAKNKIKTVSVTYQYKPANDRIYTKNIQHVVEYNSIGFPEKSLLINNYRNQLPDTQITWYIYTSQNFLRVKRMYDKQGYYSEYYENDPAGFLTKYTKVKEQNLTKNPLQFKPGYQEILWTESYKYEFFGKAQYKRTCINDVAQPYKQQVFNLTKAGGKLSIYTTYTVTATGSEEEFTYNNNNQIIEKKYFSNTGNYLSERYTYEYKNNLLDKEFYFLNEVQVYECFYFYSNNYLLESSLKKMPNGNMEITKYSY
ncbi:MAG: hypothetical protein IT239_00030, partial [Bacteroidia bacterium]|nr:hypothetical protein [Bacteroidia bacterium]